MGWHQAASAHSLSVFSADFVALAQHCTAAQAFLDAHDYGGPSNARYG